MIICSLNTYVVPCPTLADPNNGVITCLLGDDGTPTEGDTCTVTCNSGYVVNGSDTMTCGSSGMWSNVEATCSKGIELACNFK